MNNRRYTDDDLAAAIAAAHSWRGVLRCLGLNDTSAGSMRSARRRANELDLSYEHFTGQRRWTDRQLERAVAEASSWTETARLLDLVPAGGTLTALRAHALRLGLPTDHLDRGYPEPSSDVIAKRFRRECLRDAGTLFAATWFMLCGARVIWPLEPCRYDLVADVDTTLHRVQVKTTTGSGPTAMVSLSNSRRRGRAVYGPGEIDAFFVIDAGLSAYLIPYPDVAGYGTIQLGRYVNFRVVDRGQLAADAA